MKAPVVLIAHNIRSLWNIGSFFRTCDAFSVSHVHLTGYTAAPPRVEITKTALGAEGWIPWSKDTDVFSIIEERRKQGFQIASLEISQSSVPLTSYIATKPTCLIVGHEITGVSADILAASDIILHIPMSGRKHSLNVSVALGIALYQLMHRS